jgi:hypothetical protein
MSCGVPQAMTVAIRALIWHTSRRNSLWMTITSKVYSIYLFVPRWRLKIIKINKLKKKFVKLLTYCGVAIHWNHDALKTIF